MGFKGKSTLAAKFGSVELDESSFGELGESELPAASAAAPRRFGRLDLDLDLATLSEIPFCVYILRWTGWKLAKRFKFVVEPWRHKSQSSAQRLHQTHKRC